MLAPTQFRKFPIFNNMINLAMPSKLTATIQRTKTNRKIKIKEMKKWMDYRSGRYLTSWLVEIIVGMTIELTIRRMMEEEIQLGKSILEAK